MTPYQSTFTKRSGPETANHYAQPGRERKDVIAPSTTIATSAPDVAQSPMELRAVLKLRKRNPTTPYKADSWDRILKAAGLLPHFAKVPEGI
jgi:hypothetical protein